MSKYYDSSDGFIEHGYVKYTLQWLNVNDDWLVQMSVCQGEWIFIDTGDDV